MIEARSLPSTVEMYPSIHPSIHKRETRTAFFVKCIIIMERNNHEQPAIQVYDTMEGAVLASVEGFGMD